MTWLHEHLSKHPIPPPLELPRRFEEASLALMPAGPVKDMVEKYLRLFWDAAPRGIAPLIVGRTQTWKTYGAAIVARRVHQAGVPVQMVMCPVEMAEVERDRFSELSRQRVERWKRVPFLIMDDFVQLDPGTFASQLLVEIACDRHANMLPTMWTGNIILKPSEKFMPLVNRYGALFARRLKEGSEGYALVVK